VTVKSTGTGPLHIGTITLTGTQSAAYKLATDGCSGKTLAPAATCTVTVTFSPTAAGTARASVRIPDDAPGSPQLVSLTGNGQTAAATLTPTSLSWNQGLRATPTTKRIVVKSTGATALRITALGLGGNAPSVFQIVSTSTCRAGLTLAVGSTCSIDLRFVPTTRGTFKAAVTVTTSNAAPSRTLTGNLTGTAT
jgi:hypothetical protein